MASGGGQQAGTGSMSMSREREPDTLVSDRDERQYKLTQALQYLLSKESAPVKGVAPAIARARAVRPTLEPLQVPRRLLDLRLFGLGLGVESSGQRLGLGLG